jgi:hypothetical protein
VLPQAIPLREVGTTGSTGIVGCLFFKSKVMIFFFSSTRVELIFCDFFFFSPDRASQNYFPTMAPNLFPPPD